MTTPSSKRYRIKNWKEYNKALVQRGSLTLWVNEDTVQSWYETALPCKPGSPRTYSDLAIQCCLTFRALYRIPLRATQGFVASLFQLLGIPLDVPNYSTLCRRQKTLQVRIPISRKEEPMHVVVDSTGMKVYGEGEWKMRTHGKQKRRTWRKLHLAIDVKTREIVAAGMSLNSVGDSEGLPQLLETIEEKINQVTTDGAYDSFGCYEAIKKKGAKAVIPPREGARITHHGNRKTEALERDEHIRFIRKHGKKRWKKATNYHQRSLAENGMYRFKTCFGEKLLAHLYESQMSELAIKASILNLWTGLGMPDSHLIAV